LRCQDRGRDKFGELVSVALGVDSSLKAIHIEASVAAVWDMLHSRVGRDRAPAVHGLEPFLSYTVLAPLIGPSAAIEAVRYECGLAGRKLTVTTNLLSNARHIRYCVTNT
jgi:hypothetical protein